MQAMADTEETTQLELVKEDPEEVTEEQGNTVSPETAGPDVPLHSPGDSATVDTGVSLPGGGTACEAASQIPVIPAALSTDSEVAPTTSEETECRDVSEPVRETGSSDAALSDEETDAPLTDAPLSLVGSESGSTVTSQLAGDAVIPVTSQPAGEAGIPVSSQPAGDAGIPVTAQPAGDTGNTGSTVATQPAEEAITLTTPTAGEADSTVTTQPAEEADGTATTQPAEEADSPVASEVDTIKVEVDYAEQSDEEMDEGEDGVTKTPVVSSAHEESSFCSLDMGVDMVENMDTGTDEQIDQEVEKEEEEEEDKKMIVQQDSTDSKSSVVNAVSLREDSQSPAILIKEKDRSPHIEGIKRQLDQISSSSSSPGEVAPRPVSAGPVGKDSGGLKNGVRRRQRVEQPRVEVKDEPVDEEYDKALAPANAASEHVKDEPETAEDNLKISAVFSVGGASSPNVSTASPVPTTARGQLSSAPLIPASMCVACSGCKKVLTKGQTAYQKKGSSHLFCSTKCLTSFGSAPTPLVKAPVKKTCHYCRKDILNLKDLIKAPVDLAGTIKDFCSQPCHNSFNFKRNSAVSTLSSSPSPSSISSSSTPTLNNPKAKLSNKPCCAACKKTCMSYSHEVVHQGSIHKLCSDVCFKSFCSTNQLSLNTCAHCGGICQDKVSQMRVSGATKSFCNAVCQASYKQKNKRPTPCTMCHACRPMTDMNEVTDSEGVTELYCSAACVTAFKVQTVSASGAQVECENCRQRKVPAYHLAMSDSSIRNFCALSCVLTFQEQFNKDNTQKPMNVAQITTVPPPSQSQTSQTTHPALGGVKLPCFQCLRLFTTKPELFQIKEKMVVFCGSACSEKYKKANPSMDRCEYCKIEKITTEVRRINGKDCAFCSEGCKLLFKHDLNKLWGRHCRLCSYCSSTSQKLVTGQFAGKSENFCSETCRSKFTMLFCQVAKCDACGRQGKLTETLPMLGEVKHFCDLQCLVQFCSQKTLSQSKVPVSIAPVGTTVSNSATPVIANVVSLASAPTGQPNVFANTALQGAVPSSHMKIVGNASTQTPSGPPPPPPRVLKNKALLCKPIVQNKGIICKPQMVNSECQTDDYFKVMVLPVPVPVYVPVPMNLYTQYTPKPLGLPIPVPVPMFLPVTLDSAERLVETIQEIKEKIPSNPFEADVLLMAEMVAEEGEAEKVERRPTPAPVQDDQLSNFSEDLNTDDLTSFLDDWQEESTSSGLRSNRSNRLYSSEKLPPILDVPVGEPEPEPQPQPAIMDIESEFPIETLEMMAHWREQGHRSPSPPPPPSPPRRGRRKVQQKKKRGRRSRASVAAAAKEREKASAVASLCGGQAASLEPPRLQNKYGVDAWRRWVQWRNTQSDVEPVPRFGMRPMVLKEELLQCTTAELGFGLCRFISEVKRPNGETYSADSLFYLCLGIQQYLFENGRMENIFTDVFYGKFTTEISELLRDFQPTITAGGYVHSRVEEDYLWDCKQLGAYSPIVLLNTLLFFCTKLFGFRTIAQHRQLSFGHVMRCTTSNGDGTKTNFLRFYPPIPLKEQAAAPDADTPADTPAAKKRKEEPEKESVLEMVENSENPLRCPVRLYEFYLSKCSESVKQRTNLFYLHPERSCVPNSPLWYSSMPLDNTTMETMLTRILTIREIHLTTGGEGGRKGEGKEGEKAEKAGDDEAYSPPAYEDDDDDDYWEP